MLSEKVPITSGVEALDRLLGGLFIGDNVIWYDTAGSLASAFCLNFIRASHKKENPLIYVSFDRSPKNLLEKLGSLAQSPSFVLLDCFTHGKGAGSDIFLKFYEQQSQPPCRIICVENPHDSDCVAQSLYDTHKTMIGDVYFVVESLTGIQSLWNGEDDLLRFYSRTCPRLYELNTVAYWIMEKHAHSQRLRAHINTIAQVAIELSVKRGKTFLSVLKAEKRDPGTLNRAYEYRARESDIVFDTDKGETNRMIDMGARLKELRIRRGISQTELARLIGVTPSNISQVESSQIYPSVPALLKIAETLGVNMSSFFQESAKKSERIVFPASDAVDMQFSDLPKDSILVKRLFPVDVERKVEPYLIEILPEKSLPSHFFFHKGGEIGYCLSGRIQMKLGKTEHLLTAGDTVYLESEIPSRWKNETAEPARLLWMKIK